MTNKTGGLEGIDSIVIDPELKEELLLHPYTSTKKSVRMAKVFSSIKIKKIKSPEKKPEWPVSLKAHL